MSKDKNLIRVGDYVKIVNPLVVTRVGYPLSKLDMVDKQTPEQVKAIEDMFKAFNYHPSPWSEGVQRNYTRFLDAVRYKMASIMISQAGWGGKERTIHTINLPDMMDKKAKVTERRVVKTGIYNAGWGTGYDSYNGYEDYDPPTLGSERTHVVFTVEVWGHGENWSNDHWFKPESKKRFGNYYTCDYRPIEIEKCNLLKISKEEYLKPYEVNENYELDLIRN